MKQKRVLLVDDVRLFLEVTRSFFSRDKVQMTTASNGLEALKSVRALRPDLIIMDLNMPEMDGAASCRAIKADPELARIPVILLFDGSDRSGEERCRQAGCDATLSKPCHRQRLLEVARNFLKVPVRIAPRVPIRLLVRYGVEDQRTLHDYTVNFSAGGIFLATALILPVETPVTLEFLVPGTEMPVICKGRVAWINPAGEPIKGDLPAGLGLQFVDVTPKDQQIIGSYLEKETLVLLPEGEDRA